MVVNKNSEYYTENKDALKENAKNKYSNLAEEGKEARTKYGKNRYRNIKKWKTG